MISCSTVIAILLRHVRLLRSDTNMLLMVFYWPLLDILIWGFLGAWIQRSQISEFANYEAAALLGILLWQIVGRGCNVMEITFCEELWSSNVINLFSLPLRIGEWIVGVILYTAFIITLTFLFGLVVISALYDVSVGYLCSTFLLFSLPLFFSMVWLGFTCLQIVVLLGRRGSELGFVMGWLFMPFSGAYYPVEVLPAWGQKISALLPMSYVFQGMRAYVMRNQDPTPFLIKGYAMGIVYAAVAMAMFVYCFNRTKRKGLARLVD